MSNLPSCSRTKQNDGFEEDDIFDDSSFLANFDNSFKQTSKFTTSNLNESRNALNVSALCCDEEISGYDKLTGKTWIYPTNYPVRDYQFNIIRAAILKNTLVSLPTGLGKTFIAAVIMYNFYRWYPLGKIVFTAPTRPLVAQQIEACYNIIAIPPNDTIEMTGHMQVNTRRTHWQNKRVFFATPQVIYNDIKSGICPSDKIRCLVIDEAHRAKGNYAYCQIVSTLDDMGHKTYRVLALSATPGSKVEDVINVVKSLHIAHLELRTENCIDVAPYSHARKINTVVIELSHQLNMLRQHYVEILDGYARRLKQLNILPHNLGNLSKGRIVMLYKEFQTKERGARHPQHNLIMKDFTLLIALYHGLELLVQHGSRVFLNFFDEHPEKSWIQSDDRLTALLERLRDDLGINPLSLDRSILPDGTVPEMPSNLYFGHPKFDKLKEIMVNHFTKAQQNKQDTRAIVFCEYRESVNLVHCLLLQCRPLIKPQMFVGQGASGKDGKTVVSQKQQLRVMRSFREGACNALVATCVAEEGLDVGSVDLILCFDISTRSPIRLVQRCGRTGRERGGQVFILVTEGREHQTLMDCMRQRDGLNKKIQQSKEVENNLYKLNPRMMPRDFTPVCHKMYVTVQKKEDPKDMNKDANEKAKKGQKDLRSMLLGTASTSNRNTNKEEASSHLISENEFKELYPNGFRETALLPKPKEFWAMSKDSFKKVQAPEESELKLNRWLEWQRSLQKTVNVSHSRDSEMLAELLQYADAKRFEMPPSTQFPCFSSQESPKKMTPATQKLVLSSPAKIKPIKRKKAPVVKSPAKKDGDIRALFSTATKSTKNYTKLITDLGIQNDGSIPTKLISLFVDLSLENTHPTNKCYICQNICECSAIKKLKEPRAKSLNFLSGLILPDIGLINDINADAIMKCAIKIEKTYDEECDEKESIVIEKLNLSNNFDLELDFLALNDSDSESVIANEPKKQDVSTNFDTFDVGDIEDIFADSSPEEATAKEAQVNEEPKNVEGELKDDKVKPKDVKVEPKDVKEAPKDAKEALGFFGLDSIEDIFADDVIDNTPPETTSAMLHKYNKTDVKLVKSNSAPKVEYPLSPSILSGRAKPKTFQTSPILCSQGRKLQLSTKKRRPDSSTPVNTCRKQLIKGSQEHDNFVVEDDKPESLIKDSLVDTSNKSMFTITQLVDMINKTDRNLSTSKNISIPNEIHVKDDHERSVSPILPSQCKRNTSPILLTQSERSKLNDSIKSKLPLTQNKSNVSLIILESDSDSDSTQIYDPGEKSKPKDYFGRLSLTPERGRNVIASTSNKSSPGACKRKLDWDDNDPTTASPYFNKKPKLSLEEKQNSSSQKDTQLTFQQKAIAALSKSNINKHFKNDSTTLNCVVSSNGYFPQKENTDPQILKFDDKTHDNCMTKSNLSMLQMFRRNSKVDTKEISEILKTGPTKSEFSQKRKILFDDSDDEFVTDNKSKYRNQPTVNGDKCSSTTYHKKKKKNNSLLDLEAELSDDEDHSGDELSDDSIGSIVDFICDDSVIPHEDMRAVYLKSIKSPVKPGAFKIPEVPERYNREDILSQFVEQDAYEMDSFCVDSNIGLTQVNEVSELELAEMILEEKRKSKKSRRAWTQQDESPEVKLKSKPKRRQIHSDSEDSE